jgi:short-subunit dehydrogenase
VITGASSGIGKAFAYELAGKGANVVLVARNKTALDTIAADIRQKFSVDARVVSADLGDRKGVHAVIEAVQSLEVGLLVNSAGFGGSGPFLNASIDDELNMVEVNCSASIDLTYSIATAMKARNRGGIILLSSLLGWQGAPYSATYSATKAFIQSFAEAIRVELKPLGIDVLAVAPGPVVSGFGGRADMTIENGVTPEVVATQSIKALGKKTTVIPGAMSKFLSYSLLILPRAFRVQIMKSVMSGLSNHGKPK